jgi:hypothetical protein
MVAMNRQSNRFVRNVAIVPYRQDPAIQRRTGRRLCGVPAQVSPAKLKWRSFLIREHGHKVISRGNG